MRFSTVLAIVAALTVSTPAVPTIVDRSVFANETGDWCKTFCIHSDECCEQICVSDLSPGLNHITHWYDSLCGCAGSSVCVASVWSTWSLD